MEKRPNRVVILAVLVVLGLIGWGLFAPDDTGRDVASAPKATDVDETKLAATPQTGASTEEEATAQVTPTKPAKTTEEQSVTDDSESLTEPVSEGTAEVVNTEEPVTVEAERETQEDAGSKTATPEVQEPEAENSVASMAGTPAVTESNTPEEPQEQLAAVSPEKKVVEPEPEPVVASPKENVTPAPSEETSASPDDAATVTPGETVTMGPKEESTDEETDPNAPRFDVVRIDRDGQTVIAGTAQPGDLVEILLDGEVVGSTKADAGGAFVTVVFADLTGEAQELQLRTFMPVALTVPKARTDDQPQTAETLAPPSADESTTANAEPAEQPAKSEDTADVSATVREPETTADAPKDEAAVEAEIAAVTPVEETADTSVTPEPTTNAGTQEAATEVEVPAVKETAPRVALSAPVIILPMVNDTDAPVLVQPRRDNVALLQPRSKDVDGVVIDQITYGTTGDVYLAGRGKVDTAIRIYGNGERLGETPVSPSGLWQFVLSREAGIVVKLFRFDAVDASGTVTSRIEAPFEYAELSPQVFRERKVVIQKGDVLWRLAEQYYGEGIRYSLIFGANAELIRDPDLIYPGQVFSIPELVAVQ